MQNRATFQPSLGLQMLDSGSAATHPWRKITNTCTGRSISSGSEVDDFEVRQALS